MGSAPVSSVAVEASGGLSGVGESDAADDVEAPAAGPVLSASDVVVVVDDAPVAVAAPRLLLPRVRLRAGWRVAVVVGR